MSAHLPVLLLSDLHGCYNTMLRLLNAVPKPCRLILSGDLIDRGPHSRQVVEFAMTGGVPTVIGNHCDLALAYSAHARRGYKARCTRDYERDIWLYNGGEETMANWQPDESCWREGLPKDVLDWMAALPAYILGPEDQLDENKRQLLASHTGYGLNADDNHWFSALWGRHAYGDGDFPDDNLYRVFGHSPVREPVVTETYACIDTAAAYASRGYNARLTALMWPSKQVFSQPFDETPVQQRFEVVDGVLT